MNKFAKSATIVLVFLMKLNRKESHGVKHTDSTDIPVCLNKNAKNHQTMKGLANWGYSGNGLFYGLKLHITTGMERKLLAIKSTSGNVHGKTVFIRLNKNLYGVFAANAAYLSEKLQREFYQGHRRILFTKTRKNMKKLITWWRDLLHQTRMTIELNFRNLKLFYGLSTSLPRPVNGYLANYIYSLLAYIIAKTFIIKK